MAANNWKGHYQISFDLSVITI
uniref:Uncharacterized protein n=1 Tax=Arundo donax TaxID=35708 RepID=A0A0A9CKM6_ARUDO